MKYDFDFTSLLTNDSFKVTNADGKTTIQYFESDAIAKTTEITEKGVSLKDISIVNSNGDEISVNTFFEICKNKFFSRL